MAGHHSRRAPLLGVVLVLAALAWSCSSSPPGGKGGSSAATGAAGSAKGATTTAPSLTAPTAPPPTVLGAVDLHAGGAPPWSGPKITTGIPRQIATDAWQAAPNRTTTKLVIPADLALAPTAFPRPQPQPGGWAVAWDDPGKPGVTQAGVYCDTCGRGVAGVAGTSTPATKAAATSGAPTVVQWNDGSAVGYGQPPVDGHQYMANVYIAGQGTTYQVWSYISVRNLEYLISQLRFVAGAP